MNNEEAEAVERINHFRHRHGRKMLKPNRKLEHRARHWAWQMRLQKRFSHDGVRHRLRGFGWWGECVGWTEPMSAEEMVRWWIHSPEHRRILLGRRFRLIGLGQSGEYWCADLAIL